MNKLTQERLKEVLNYNPKTGGFAWLVTRNGRAVKGERAGCMQSRGYWRIQVDGKRYFAHRLAWLYEYGYFPENDLDHIDRCKINNSITNLREVSAMCNLRNSGVSISNKSGVTGVIRNRDRWQAQIKINYVSVRIGVSEDFLEAVCLRLAAEQAIGWEGCNSSSSAYEYVQSHINKGA